ncbi:MAG: HNH endonuclease [Ardenticatenales bacterium]|nr:HNH endonuclease [Ardenticatenales bacterium]
MQRVFVLDATGEALMPCHPARARKLLKAGRAVVVHQQLFTIKLLDRVGGETQPVMLKLDPGSRVSGLVLVGHFARGAEVLWAGELTHRGPAIRDNLTQRASVRRSRRSRKTRYRKPRFLHRRRRAGWLAPSLQSRVDNILSWVRRLRGWCPVSGLAMELVRFDTQLLQNPEISGVEYQQGTLHGYEVREYVLEKWGRQCAYCDATGVALQVEHIQARTAGGSHRVSNLTLACEDCNQAKGSQDIRTFLAHDPPRLARILAQAQTPLRDAAAVNSTRWALYEALQVMELPLEGGTGGRTKYNRTQQAYPKAHWVDAACVGVSGAQVALDPAMPILQIKAMGRGSRQMCRMDKYGFPRTGPKRFKRVQGFQTGDLVVAVVLTGKKAGRYVGRVAVRASGYFNILTRQGTLVQGIPARCCRVQQRADGYHYAIGPVWCDEASLPQCLASPLLSSSGSKPEVSRS